MATVRALRLVRSLAVFGACLALAAACGCGGGGSSKATVSGKVTYKAAPVTGGTLTLYPASGPPVLISLKPDGTFSSDVPIGQMGVAVETRPPMIPPGGTDMSKVTPYVALPAKYKDPKTSGLTWDIKGGNNPKDFELTD